MSVAVKQSVDYDKKFANLSESTKKAAELFISFSQLEKMHLDHASYHPDAFRPNFIRWVLKQQAKYYNEFITEFAADMNWENQEYTLTKHPPVTFLLLKKAAQEGLEQ